MTSTTRSRTERPARVRQLLPMGLVAAAVIGFAVLVAISVNPVERAVFDDSLPNPMGGRAAPAPGVATGEVELAGLRISGAEVAMGEVGLGITYVPSWEVTNTTDAEVVFTAGEPQILEGCCPGPVYLDGELTHAGQGFVVPAGGSVVLQFPLQMHRGMDGPHRLALPLVADGARTAVEVTGDFTASAAG